MSSFGISQLHVSTSRRHVTMIMAIDTSGSMVSKGRDGKSRIRAAGEGASEVLNSLESGDHVATLGFGTEIEDLAGGVVELSASNKASLKNRV